MSGEEYRVEGLPEPISHYTDAVRAGELLFVSGIVPVDGRAARRRDDVVAQARRCSNIGLVLAAAGASFADVVKVTMFLTDVEDRRAINPVRQEFFGDARPARRSSRSAGSRSRARRSRSRRSAVLPVSDDPLERASSPGSRAREGARAARRGRLLVKDLIDTAGIRTTYGSQIYADHVPERTAPCRRAAARRRRGRSSARRTCPSSRGA